MIWDTRYEAMRVYAARKREGKHRNEQRYGVYRLKNLKSREKRSDDGRVS